MLNFFLEWMYLFIVLLLVDLEYLKVLEILFVGFRDNLYCL